nr:MAG: hypothetical protein DIU58_17700 [Sphaerobacter thermophilus]
MRRRIRTFQILRALRVKSMPIAVQRAGPLFLAAMLFLLPGPASAQSTSWMDLLQKVTPPDARGRSPARSGPGFECKAESPDSLVLSNHIEVESRRLPTMFVAGQRVYRPYQVDTLTVEIAAAYCTHAVTGGGLMLRELILHRDGYYLSYQPYYLYEDLSPLAFLFVRNPDGELSPAGWDGRRLVDLGPYLKARADSIAREERARREAERRAAAERARREAERAARIRSYGWPAHFAEAVIARRVMIGMTAEMVREAWGRPERINETITASGRFEQWVYGLGEYIYLENGVVTTIQTSR